MAETTFKLGDVVVLKSGGPKMTVHATEGESVACIWYNATTAKIDFYEYFRPHSLQLASEV